MVRRLRQGRAWVVGAALVGSTAGLAPAQGTAVEPVRFSYTATDGCPQQDAFVGQIMARTARVRVARHGEPGRTFVVNVQRSDAQYAGTLTVTQPSGQASVRRVSAAICDEVVEALALVAALTVDPQASTRPASELPPPAVAPPPTPSANAVPPAAPQPAPAALQPVPTAVPSAAPPAPPPPVVLVTSPAEPEPGPTLVVGAGAQLRGGVAPGATLGLTPAPQLFADLGSGGSGLVAPRGGLTLSGWSNRANGTWGDAQLLWLTGRLEGCPLNLTSSGAVALRPCATLEVGGLRGWSRNRSVETEPATDAKTWLWLAAGALLRFELELGEVVQLRAEGGLGVPLMRPTFVYEVEGGEDEEVFFVPNLASHFGLGVGLPFVL